MTVASRMPEFVMPVQPAPVPQSVILTWRVYAVYGAAIGLSSAKVVVAPLRGAAVLDAEIPRLSTAGVADHCAFRTCSRRWFARNVAVEVWLPSWVA